MYYLMQALQTNHRLPSIRQKENCVIDSCYLTSLLQHQVHKWLCSGAVQLILSMAMVTHKELKGKVEELALIAAGLHVLLQKPTVSTSPFQSKSLYKLIVLQLNASTCIF
jgi:hypothetical protein